MTTIYDFIADPFKAVRAGYRPTYMTCVSAVANRGSDFVKHTIREVFKFRNVLRWTITELFVNLLLICMSILSVVTFPIGIWFWGWIQYLNVQHAIRADERIDALHR